MKFCPAPRGRFALNVALLSLASAFLISIDSTNAQGIHDPQFKTSVPCDKLKDGNYVWGCNRIYSMCANGKDHQMQCYDTLVLDPDVNQCEDPKAVRICGRNQPFSLYRSKDPFTCKGQADGTYEAAACGGQYYQCHGGRQFVQTCPAGLVYNQKTLGCDFPDNCNSNLQKSQAKPIQLDGLTNGDGSQHNSQNSSPKAPIPKRRMQNQKFFNLRRSANKAGPPFQLVKEGSNLPSQVADTFIVQNGQAVPNAPSTAYGAPVLYGNSAQPHAPQSQQAAAAPAPPTSDFDCAGKQDGIHLDDSSACTATFWKCANEFAHEYECPAGLFYDATTGQCDHEQFVVACGGTPTTTTVAPPAATGIVAAQAPPDFDCTGKKDGVYVKQPCSQTYFTCNGGSSWPLKCPGTTVFDTNTNSCDYPNQCGKPKPTSPPQEAHGAANFYFNQDSDSSTTTTPKPPFDCTGKQDGYYYKKKCTSKFIICSKGHLSQQECPIGTLFDPTIAQCQYANECGKSTTTPATTTTTTTTAAPQFIVSSTPKPNFNCSGREDGYYVSQPCTSTFFTCASGYTIQLSCPPTLVFDPSTKICEYPNICGLSLTTAAPSEDVAEEEKHELDGFEKDEAPPFNNNANDLQSPYTNKKNPNAGPTGNARKSAQNAYQKPSQSSGQQIGAGQINAAAAAPTVPSVQTTTSAPADFDCSGQSDGFHAKTPCINTYYSCSAGTATQLQCPNGLVFDATAVFCDYPSECGQPKTTTTTAAPLFVATAPSAVAASSAPIYTGQGAGPKTFSCEGRANGYFINGNCQSSFYACHDGVSTKMRCPTGLLLDTTTAVCEYAEACGRPKTEPNYVEAPQQQPISAAVEKPDFDCTGKDNGEYGQGHCQSSYIICANEVPHVSHCPSPLVFDESVGQCEYSEQCGQNFSSGEEVEEGEQPQQTAPIQTAAKTPSPPSSSYIAPKSAPVAANSTPVAASNSAPVPAANSAPVAAANSMPVVAANSAPVAAANSAPAPPSAYPPAVSTNSGSGAKSARRSQY